MAGTETKYTKYLLIGGVLVIWALVIMRIVQGLRNEETPLRVSKKTKKIDYAEVKDSFTLFAKYRDPFLDENPDLEIQNDSLNVGKTPQSTEGNVLVHNPTQTVDPGFESKNIVYQGMIENKTLKKAIALLSINGEEISMKEKSKYLGVTVIKIRKDKIWLSLNNITRIYYKQ